MSGNRLGDFASIVEDLDATGRLIRVRSEVDPHLELAAVAARFEGGPRAVLFENVKGHDAPVLAGLYWSRELLAELMQREEHALPQYVSDGGCGFYHAIVSIRQTRAGWSKQAILAAFAAFPPLKMVTVVDDDVDIRDASDVEWAMATRFDPTHGIVRIDNIFGHGLNPGFPGYLGTKVGFDACRPFPHSPEYDRAAYDEADLAKHDIDIPAIRSGSGRSG